MALHFDEAVLALVHDEGGRADLLVDGQVAISTTVTIAPTVAMPTLARFSTSTRKAYDARAKTPSASVTLRQRAPR